MKTMKAWRLAAYNTDPGAAIDSMTLETNVKVPSEIGPDQVLVRVKYASINPIDWKLFTGTMHGIVPISAFPYTPGFDIAGTVETIGSNVTDYAVGNSVICDIGLVESCVASEPNPCGAFAEYAVVPSNLCAKVASGKDLKDYAGLPLAGLTSYQALFTGAAKSFTGEDLGSIVKGSKVLILGGASGTGAMAIELAKNVGAHVACTASDAPMPNGPGMNKMEYCKSLGADVVVNYKKQDWAEVLKGMEYDQIFDCVGLQDDLTVRAPKVLKKGGVFVSIANFDPSSKSTDDVRFAVFFIKSDKKDLAEMVKMIDEGKLNINIDTCYSMAEGKEALKKSLGGRAAGKVLIKVQE